MATPNPKQKTDALSFDDALNLNGALASKGLKAKHVSGGNYIRIINLKTTLRNAMKTLDEAYRTLAEEFEMEEVGPGQFTHPKQDKVKQLSFGKKVNETNREWKSPGLDLHFIPKNELEEFCKEQDVEIVSILFEFLLKPEDKK